MAVAQVGTASVLTYAGYVLDSRFARMTAVWNDTFVTPYPVQKPPQRTHRIHLYAARA
jgi:hypothetical protein